MKSLLTFYFLLCGNHSIRATRFVKRPMKFETHEAVAAKNCFRFETILWQGVNIIGWCARRARHDMSNMYDFPLRGGEYAKSE